LKSNNPTRYHVPMPPNDRQRAPEPEWLSDVEQAAWRSYIRAAGRVNRLVSRQLKDAHDLSIEDFGILAMLSESEGHRLRFGELCRLLCLPGPFLTYRARRLEEAGLVERLDCPDDKRAAYLALTPSGASAVVETAPCHVASVRRAIFDHLDDDQLTAFAEVMNVLDRALGHDPDRECDGTIGADGQG